MNLEPFADESAFIQSTNIFEWTPGEKRLRQHHNKTGFEAILDILDGLGYYGVRFHRKEKLDPFGIIVGGLSWCIGYIKPEYNYDIAFSEGMSLGQKITLSEHIISCLREMKYPESIWPQQIQGLDYRVLENLFRWLAEQITEIRNFLPKYESLAAQQEFDDSFIFDELDCPPSSSPFQTPSQYSLNTISPSSYESIQFIHSPNVTSCSYQDIYSFHSYLSHYHSTWHEGISSFSNISIDEETLLSSSSYTMNDSSSNLQALTSLKQQRLNQIQALKEEEAKRIAVFNSLSQEYLQLQQQYQQTETEIQHFAATSRDTETSAKLRELQNLMKLLESLNMQYNKNIQSYEEEISYLNKQLEIRRETVAQEYQECSMIQGIQEKVYSSLSNLLSIYRSINLCILKCQCFLERIPSTPELLFFENEISLFMNVIGEKSLEYSQVIDVKNYDTILIDLLTTQSSFLESFITVLKSKRSLRVNEESVTQSLTSVIQQLNKLIQQYNSELKKKNRTLKTSYTNQGNVLEKVRLHSKLMQTFRIECENNKELMKRIRELQSRRS